MLSTATIYLTANGNMGVVFNCITFFFDTWFSQLRYIVVSLTQMLNLPIVGRIE